jgi:hypothetical protein
MSNQTGGVYGKNVNNLGATWSTVPVNRRYLDYTRQVLGLISELSIDIFLDNED